MNLPSGVTPPLYKPASRMSKGEGVRVRKLCRSNPRAIASCGPDIPVAGATGLDAQGVGCVGGGGPAFCGTSKPPPYMSEA